MTERLKPHTAGRRVRRRVRRRPHPHPVRRGVVAQVVAGGTSDHDSISWAWGLGVTSGVLVAARISGAHLDPAVTVTTAKFRGSSWSRAAPFIGAQLLGSLVAALVIRWDCTEVVTEFDLGPRPASFVTGYGGALRDQNGSRHFWVPIVGPLVGGPVGAAQYDALVGRHLPTDDELEPGRTTTDPDEDLARADAHAHDQGTTQTDVGSETHG